MRAGDSHNLGATVSEGNDTRITTSSGKCHPVDGNRFPFVSGHRQRMQEANTTMAVSFDTLTDITGANMALNSFQSVMDEKCTSKDIGGFAGTPMSSLDGGVVGGEDGGDAGCRHTDLQATPKFPINAYIFRATIRQGADTHVVIKDFMFPIWIFNIIVSRIIKVN